MKILLYGLNYAPELTGIGKYTGEMAQWLARRGHEVVVITTPPYYPEWSIHQDHRNFYSMDKWMPGFPRVLRAPLYVPAVPTGGRRLLHLASFMGSSFPVLMAAGLLFRPDVVLTIEPSFVCVVGAVLLATLTRAASWLHVQDFEIDAGFQLGLVPTHQFSRRLAFGIEKILLRSFTRVSSISPEMVERSQEKGAAKAKTVLFPNWVDVDHIYPCGAANRYRTELRLEEKTVLLYSGNMGNKQGLELLAPLVAAFGPGGTYENPTVHFLFCGDGSFRPQLAAMVGGMPNATMLGLQPYEDLNELLNVADIHLLPQRARAAKLVMPSKLTGILASGRPVIATAELGTQLAKVIGYGDGACGILVPPEDSRRLHDAVAHLVGNPERRRTLGANARAYAVGEMCREAVLLRFERDLHAVVPPIVAKEKARRAVRAEGTRMLHAEDLARVVSKQVRSIGSVYEKIVSR